MRLFVLQIDLGIEKEGELGKRLSYTLAYERWLFPDADAGERQLFNNFAEACLSGQTQKYLVPSTHW